MAFYIQIKKKNVHLLLSPVGYTTIHRNIIKMFFLNKCKRKKNSAVYIELFDKGIKSEMMSVHIQINKDLQTTMHDV